MTQEIKLCRDCKHLTGDQCGHAAATSYDYVNGDHKRIAAQIERSFATATGCGPTAKNFEAKESPIGGD